MAPSPRSAPASVERRGSRIQGVMPIAMTRATPMAVGGVALFMVKNLRGPRGLRPRLVQANSAQHHAHGGARHSGRRERIQFPSPGAHPCRGP